MGSAQCCTKQQLEEKETEIQIKQDAIMKQSGTQQDNPLPKKKLSSRKSSPDEPGTPGFADLRSQQSKKSEQHQSHSQKEIQLIGQLEKHDSPFKSQTSIGKRKNDSPVCNFEATNKLKSLDSNRLKKIQTFEEKLNSRDLSPIEDDGMLDSQRSKQADEKSVKSILKQELKYSKFRKQDTTFDAGQRKVQFCIE
ncbi:unnamed protein product (macronuclear) [Paramecium tetraurelia]|uniref:Uncharacterized protein n=1 Tax=Paramecium tetraurelia TaxID=5888 RepID=A0DZZ9_PARTE|nr:uncharacterized protein GSPATT00021784001 [Paramecium tetraurelia]CAK88616.1 unnamed protein product [Paramecium tetraurelia]|eukprot:XP_001456013.1 hypothetical protein (macronuclear) [Paramecium tetraurelia strain d4-2]